METSTTTVKPPEENKIIKKSPEQERINLIRRTVATGTTNDEFLMFLYQAKRTGLDPLARQINIIVRGKAERRKATIQASIDGLRLVAHRSKEYAGQDAPIFDEKDGQPIKCTMAVYKFSPTGERYPAAVAVAYMSEYKPAPPNDFMWNKMPHTMLSKVAEALALRKAFPQDLSGIYGEEEMGQGDVHQVVQTTPPALTATVPTTTPETTPPAATAPVDPVLAGDTVDQPEPPKPVDTNEPALWDRAELQELRELAMMKLEGANPLMESSILNAINTRFATHYAIPRDITQMKANAIIGIIKSTGEKKDAAV